MLELPVTGPDQKSGGMSRSEARCPVGLSPVPQPVNNTDRQTDVHTHTHTHTNTHTVFRCVRRVSGSSADLRCVPCFTPSLPGKHGLSRSEQRPRPCAVTRRTHTQRLDVSTQPHSCSWLLCAHCSVHTAAAHAHFYSGFCLRVGNPNFYCSTRNKPTGPNTRPVPSLKAPPCTASLDATASLVMPGFRPTHTVTCRCFRLHVS